jgi:hypothetical protein
LNKKDAIAPSDLAAYVLAWAREHPDKFLPWLATLEGPAPKGEEQNGIATGTAERVTDAAQAPLNEQHGGGVTTLPPPAVVPAKMIPQNEQPNGPRVTPEPLANAPTPRPAVTAEKPQNVRLVFVREMALLQAIRKDNGHVLLDGHVIACEIDLKHKGVVLSIVAPRFSPVPDGQPVPELAPRWRGGR